MSDILERLLDFENDGITSSDRFHLRHEAANEIERLRLLQENSKHWEAEHLAEIERLRATLEEIADDPVGISSYQADMARRALEGKGE